MVTRKKKLLILTVLSSLIVASSCFIFSKFSVQPLETNAAANNYTLTISSFTWKNTYYCYANTTNGNKLTFERKSRWSDNKYGFFCNSTKIHYIKSITATFSATSTVKVKWNNATKTTSYTDIPSPGWGENVYYDEATITSGKKYSFSYGSVMYFALYNSSEGNDLGLTKIVINYTCSS